MTIRARFPMLLLPLALLAFLVFGATASAAPIAKDGKIYACYKAKGKGKGTLRLVRSGKARCPRQWKKVSWYANGGPGNPGLVAPPGPAGPKGDTGPQGEKGTAGNVVVTELEDKVTELLTKVQSLETVLNGVTNSELLGAIEAVPAVGALCEQAEDLTDQTTALGSTLGSLNTVLSPLLIGFSPVSVPTALPSFNCPTS